MKIIDIEIGRITVPLKTPFKTALRTVSSVNDIIVKVITDSGEVGYGEAPPTGVITGDTHGSIISAINDHIKKAIVGFEVENIEGIMKEISKSIIKNNSAKAAIDMAVYDLYGKLYNTPLYKLLGGYREELKTDITISVNEPEEMVYDAVKAVNLGYKTLKIKVGKDSSKDIKRLKAISQEVGNKIILRIDANQAWRPKEAVAILRKIEELDLNVELVEQPVVADDIEGLKFVSNNINIPVLADESIFSPKDAIKVIQNRAADIINIKLMKTGGIYNALKICSIAEIYGVECMIGCMLEANVSVTAAAHLAMAKNVITRVDLDSPMLCKENPVVGGAVFNESIITMNNSPGLGIESIDGYVNI